MKRLLVVDVAGNDAAYELRGPAEVTEWRAADLLACLSLSAAAADDAGYLFAPVDALRHETLRALVERPGSTLNAPPALAWDDRILEADDVVRLDEATTVVALTREPVGQPEDWSPVDLAAWHRRIARDCPALVEAIDAALGLARRPLGSLTSVAQLLEGGAPAQDVDAQLRLLYRAARALHAAPFENASKLEPGHAGFRPGHETWANVARGRGGVCSEKAAALICLCDLVGWPARSVVASTVPLPATLEDDLLRHLAEGPAAPFRHYLQHELVLVHVDGVDYLVDATGGNLPLLLLAPDDAARRFATGTRGQMVYSVERLLPRPVSRPFGDTRTLLATYHTPLCQLDLIVDQGLGLYIGPDLWVGAYFDYGPSCAARRQLHYHAQARKRGYAPPRCLRREQLDAWDDPMAAPLAGLLDRLTALLPDPHYTGELALVVQPLRRDRWARPQVSRGVARALGAEADDAAWSPAPFPASALPGVVA